MNDSSVGLEIMEDVGEFDVVLVCCGGGGSVSGIASAIKLSGKNSNCRVYAVEPEKCTSNVSLEHLCPQIMLIFSCYTYVARTMYESYKADKAVSMAVSSIASGLSPPFAGTCSI